MMKYFLFFVFSLPLYSCLNVELKVAERGAAIRIGPGYYVAEEYETFKLANEPYLIQSREFFDDEGVIQRAVILLSEGYYELPKKNTIEIPRYLHEHGFSKTIKAVLKKEQKVIVVNSEEFKIEQWNKDEKKIFYKSKADKAFYIVYR